MVGEVGWAEMSKRVKCLEIVDCWIDNTMWTGEVVKDLGWCAAESIIGSGLVWFSWDYVIVSLIWLGS